MAIVRHVWTIMNDVWDESRCHDKEDHPVYGPVQFLVTVYATWAYTQLIRDSDLRSATTRRSPLTMQDLYDNYRNTFSAERFLGECEATAGNAADFMVRVANKRVRAREIFNAMTTNAFTPFASIARICARLDTNETLHHLYSLIGNKFQVFPMRLINSKVYQYTWAIVDGENDDRSMYNGQVLTVDNLREELANVKRRSAQQRRRSNAAASTRDDDDDDDDDQDHRDDDDYDNPAVVVADKQQIGTNDEQEVVEAPRGEGATVQRLMRTRSSLAASDQSTTVVAQSTGDPVFVPRSAKESEECR